MPSFAPRFCLLALGLMASLPLAAQSASGWPDTPLARTQALAELQTLNANLLSHPSATLTLEQWCSDHHLVPQAKILAERVHGQDKPLPAADRALLGIGADEPVRYRRVALRCGDIVLSDADNWYVPSRLTPEMNAQLDHSDAPFGKVVQALHFHRQTLSADLLWSPLPTGWDAGVATPAASSGKLQIPEHVLQHRAVLFDAQNQPFSLVVESYTHAVLIPPLR